MDSHESQRGSILPFVALLLTAAVAMVVVLAAIGTHTARRARAQSAADAAALAGVFEGRAGAEDLAERNDAVLVEFEALGEIVRVVVTVEGVQAEAWARLDWGPTRPAGP